MNIKELFEIGNVKTQHKVLDLLDFQNVPINEISNYIKYKLLRGNEYNDNGTLIFGLRLIYILNGQHHQNLQELYKSSTTKELFKQYIILSKSTKLIKIYLSEYKQIDKDLIEIDGFKSIAFKFSIKYFDTDIIKCCLNGSNLFKFINRYVKKEKPFVLSNLSRSIEFLKLYLSIVLSIVTNDSQEYLNYLLIMETTNYIIFDIVFEIPDPIQYEQFVNNEIPERYQLYLPLKWNQIINQLNSYYDKGRFIIIKDTETIDWMEQWLTKIFKFGDARFKFGDHYFHLLNFANVELSLYASNQLSFLHIDKKSKFYQIPLFKAILELDFETIKQIHSMGISNDFFNGFKYKIIHFLPSILLGSSGSNQIIISDYQIFNSIINYLIDHQMISVEAIFELVKFIVDNGYYNESKSNINSNGDHGNGIVRFDLDKVKINLSNLQSETLKELDRVSWNYNHFKFLLENIKFTNQNPTLHTYHDLRVKQVDISITISLIHLIIDKLIQYKEIIGNEELIVYYSLLEGLFYEFCCNKNSTKFNLEQFQLIYQLLIQNQVQLELGNEIKMGYIYCAFPILYCYLFIVSIKFRDFEIPPFDFLETYSFDQLLELVIYRPYLNQDGANDQENPSLVKDMIQFNLLFFIYIKRIDLFEKEWELVKSLGKIINCYNLVKLICINLEISSIDDILNSTEYNQIVYFCIISLKLGIFEITQLAGKRLKGYIKPNNSDNGTLQSDDDETNQDVEFTNLINSSTENILENRDKIIRYLYGKYE